MFQTVFAGDWTYRSFLRNPDLAVDFNVLKFGAGNLRIQETSSGIITGSLSDVGWSLNIDGSSSRNAPNNIQFRGKGVISAEEWIYGYMGYLAPPWPNGIDERPSIVGTIIRVVEHSGGQAKAGLVASWIAVKQ